MDRRAHISGSTRVRNRTGWGASAVRTWRSKIRLTLSERPRSRLSRISCSKTRGRTGGGPALRAGELGLQNRELIPVPARRSARVNGCGSRASHCERTRRLAADSRSQIRCSAAARSRNRQLQNASRLAWRCPVMAVKPRPVREVAGELDRTGQSHVLAEKKNNEDLCETFAVTLSRTRREPFARRDHSDYVYHGGHRGRGGALHYACLPTLRVQPLCPFALYTSLPLFSVGHYFHDYYGHSVTSGIAPRKLISLSSLSHVPA